MRSRPHRDPWKQHLFRPAVGGTLYDWMVDRGSLTTRLRKHCPAFRVQVLRQGLGRPLPDEQAALGLRPRELAWIREVLLCDGYTPVVFAHTVLPMPNVRGAWNLFAGLGNRPLGEALFTDPSITREPLRFHRLTHRHPLLRRIGALSGRSPLPARRSLFHRRGRSLLVTEVFLKPCAPF